MFIEIYEKVLDGLFPKSTLPERDIFKYIVDRYYIYTGVHLTGTSIPMYDNKVITRAHEICKYNYLQILSGNSIIDVMMIPYDINSHEFDSKERIIILCNIFKEIISRHTIRSIYLSLIFKNAPYILTIYLLQELEIPYTSKIILDVFKNEFGIDYTEDLIADILAMDIDDILNKGKIIPLLEKHNMVDTND